MALILPILANNPDSIFETTIDTINFKVRTTWNTKGEFWSISFLTPEDLPIMTGIKLVPSQDLTSKYQPVKGLLPEGVFLTIDSELTGNPITFEDLGTRIKIIHVTESELFS